tara:strand:+ start:2372 stop:2752 length:381 start_codon:yes stop_codon:yes gene_type:complete
METLIVLTVIFTVVTGMLYMILRSTTAFKDGVEATNRDAQLMAEIERLNEALTDISLDLAQVTLDRDEILGVARTTLGYVQTFTGNGFSYRKPFGEKLPEWDDDSVEPMEGWELIRKDLEAVLPKV